MKEWTDQELLRDYAERRSEAAFSELVRRHIDLVYSAALRMVCRSHLAQDVTQNTFMALAQNARQLTNRPVLSGWLHRTAQNLASKTVRTDVRRRAREQEAAAMNELLAESATDVPPDWAGIAPHLDAALGELSEPDRDALMLRYFERKSAREMAQTLGISDEAAQKRVSRAVERLRELFAKRGIIAGASGLVVAISANAVQAAPAGLVLTISAAAALAGAGVQTLTAIAATQIIAMTTLQKTLIAATLAVAVGAGIYEAHEAAQLRIRVQTILQQQTSLAARVREFEAERSESLRQLAALRADNERLNRNTEELLKLRGKVSQMQATAAQSTNPMDILAATWVSRATQVKEWMEQTPEEQIPELQLLSAKDWLEVIPPIQTWKGRTNDFEFALGVLRTRAKQRLAPSIGRALGDYLVASNGQLPQNLAELMPYFDRQYTGNIPVTEEMLQRYELMHSGNVNAFAPTEPLITESSVAQKAQYDASFKIGAFGYSYKRVMALGEDSEGPVSAKHPNELKRLFAGS